MKQFLYKIVYLIGVIVGYTKTIFRLGNRN